MMETKNWQEVQIFAQELSSRSEALQHWSRELQQMSSAACASARRVLADAKLAQNHNRETRRRVHKRIRAGIGATRRKRQSVH